MNATAHASARIEALSSLEALRERVPGGKREEMFETLKKVMDHSDAGCLHEIQTLEQRSVAVLRRV